MYSVQIFMGVSVALICALGFLKQQWLLANTRKGQRLCKLLGKGRAIWMLRAILVAGIVFGVLLAMDVIQPISW